MALVVEGKLFKVASTTSGGGSDPHNKGWFATQAALEAAYATAEAGDYAIVGSTDTVWVWDTDDSEWVDSDRKGQVTSVNNQTGAVTLGINDVAPSQTGYSGRVLGTDGFVAGWVEPEKIQRDVLPQASVDEMGNIYQYVGATTDAYTNGYFYKCVQESERKVEIAFEEQGFSFDPQYRFAFAEFMAKYGIPNYWEKLDTIRIFPNNDGAVWSIEILQTEPEEIGYIMSPEMTREEIGALGFSVPPSPYTDVGNGEITWSTENVIKWKQNKFDDSIPVYSDFSKLPSPSAENLGMAILYKGEETTVDVFGLEYIYTKGKIYSVQEIDIYEFTTTSGEGVESGCDVYDILKLVDMVGEDSGEITIVASVSGDVVTWNMDGEPIDLDDYGIRVFGVVADGDTFTITWGPRILGYYWGELKTSQSLDKPMLLADEWDEYNENIVWCNVMQNDTVIVSPVPDSINDYVNAGIRCTSQDMGLLRFKCDTVPENDIKLSIAII